MRQSAIFATALLATADIASAAAAGCNADNCLRALRATQTPGRLEAAQTFCASFTGTPTASVPVPTYAQDACKPNQNGDTAHRLSSACACLPTPTSKPTVEPCAELSSTWASLVKATGKHFMRNITQLVINWRRICPIHTND